MWMGPSGCCTCYRFSPSLDPAIQFCFICQLALLRRGSNFFCHCYISLKVSWIRSSDLKILTIGDILYTADPRFHPIHEAGSEVWILKLSNTRVEDSGEYECQLSYHEDVEKKLKMPFRLNVLSKYYYIISNSLLYTSSSITKCCM